MLRSLINFSGKKLLMPLYHAVSDNSPAHLKNLYPVRTVNEFKLDIEYILKYYKPISVSELIENINNGKEISKNRVLFTFDDGLREIVDVVAPLLKDKGIPAVFFVNSAFIDNKELFYRYKASLLIEEIKKVVKDDSVLKKVSEILGINKIAKSDISIEIKNVNYTNKVHLDEIAQILNYSFNDYLKSQKPYLTIEELKKLQGDGFYIGAHTIDHPEFYNISFDEQLKQTTESLNWVKDQFNPQYNLFAFPFTDFNVSKLFFDTLYSNQNIKPDLSFGCAGMKDDVFKRNLQRVPMEESGYSAKKVIRKEYLVYIGKNLMARNKIKR